MLTDIQCVNKQTNKPINQQTNQPINQSILGQRDNSAGNGVYNSAWDKHGARREQTPVGYFGPSHVHYGSCARTDTHAHTHAYTRKKIFKKVIRKS